MVNVETLIEEVRKYTVLYDQRNDKYRNSEYKDKICNTISTTSQVEGKYLKLPFDSSWFPNIVYPLSFLSYVLTYPIIVFFLWRKCNNS